jgi:hypothetical protein
MYYLNRAEYTNKKLIICLLVGMMSFLVISMLSSCSISNPFSSASMVDNYSSIDDLIKDSPFIVSGTVDSNNEEFDYHDVTFALTKFKIETIMRGEAPDRINILQTKMAEDPFIKNGDKMILFLIKYSGPVTEDAYRMKGLYMGQYKIEGTKVIKNPDNKLKGDEVLQNVETLKARINAIGYEPKISPISK